jgi:hypothetical protein
MNLLRGIDLTKIAEKMNNSSGAECKGVCTEAGMFALRYGSCVLNPTLYTIMCIKPTLYMVCMCIEPTPTLVWVRLTLRYV